MKKRVVVFTGGGTGGHFYPLLAIIKSLKRITGDSIKMTYVGVSHPLNKEFEAIRVPVSFIASSKLRRYTSSSNIIDFFKFLFGMFQALVKLYIIMPDLVFSKGGPGALPVILAARFYRIPVYIHESDTVPGLTNRISSYFAEKIFISFQAAQKFLPTKKTILVGNPVREELIELAGRGDKEDAKRRLGFDPKQPLILILGGSQGSARINTFVLQNIKEFTALGSVLHQTGDANLRDIEFALAGLKKTASEVLQKYKTAGFFDVSSLGTALQAADIVVSRSGAGSIFEIALLGKPSILVPLQGAAGDHQTKNAYEYGGVGACVVIEETNLSPSIVIQKIKEILGDPDVNSKMQQAAKIFARPGAARYIAETILERVTLIH